MSDLRFWKMTGTGNDFIVLDNRNHAFDGGDAARIARLCARRTGIGADGLILAEQGETAPVRMRYFNADGLPAAMCGNGARCTARFAFEQGWTQGEAAFTLQSDQGLHAVRVGDEQVALDMGTPRLLDPHPGVLQEPGWTELGLIDTGVPHYVIQVPDVDAVDLEAVAPFYRHHAKFSQGANVNIVTVHDQGITLRTFERGVEAETLSCGTGCVAAALLVHRAGKARPPVEVHTRGGDLVVEFDEAWTGSRLSGPARFVYQGLIPAGWL